MLEKELQKLKDDFKIERFLKDQASTRRYVKPMANIIDIRSPPHTEEHFVDINLTSCTLFPYASNEIPTSL